MKRYQLLFFSFLASKKRWAIFLEGPESIWNRFEWGRLPVGFSFTFSGKCFSLSAAASAQVLGPRKAWSYLYDLIPRRYGCWQTRQESKRRLFAFSLIELSCCLVPRSCHGEKRRRASHSSGESHEDWLIPFRVSFWKARRSVPGRLCAKELHSVSLSITVVRGDYDLVFPFAWMPGLTLLNG